MKALGLTIAAVVALSIGSVGREHAKLSRIRDPQLVESVSVSRTSVLGRTATVALVPTLTRPAPGSTA
jgi:hypothetical protein